MPKEMKESGGNFIILRRYRLKDKLRRNKEKFKVYFKDIHERYSLINCLLWSTSLSMTFFFIDKNNILSNYVKKLKNPLVVVAFIVLFGILLFIKLNITKLMKYSLININDKILTRNNQKIIFIIDNLDRIKSI